MGEQRRPAKRIRPAEPKPAVEPAAGRGDPLVVVELWTAPLACALQVALRDNVAEFAERLDGGWRTIVDWQTKPGIVPKWRMQKALDAALRAADDEVKVRFANRTRGDSAVWVSDSVPLDGKEHGTDRGQFVRGMGGAGCVAAVAPLDVVERLLQGLDTPVRVDDGYLDALERQTIGLYAEFAQPPGVLLRRVRPHVEEATAALDGSMSSGRRRRLNVVAGASSQLVAGLARRAGLRGDAQRHYAAALALGRDAGHVGVQAQALVGLGMLHLEAGRGPEQAKAAADYIDEAWELAATGPVPTATRSCLAAARGLAKAVGGDGDGLRAGVDDAYQALGREGPSGIGGRILGTWTEAVVERWLGEGLVRLGDAGGAIPILRPVVDRASGRERTYAMANLAEALVLADEPEEACRLLGDAAELAVAQGYGLGLRVVCGVRAGFPKHWAGLACVRELDERLYRLRLTPWLASA